VLFSSGPVLSGFISFVVRSTGTFQVTSPTIATVNPCPLFHPLPDGEGPSTAASSDDTVLSVPRLPWLFSRKAVVDDAAKINPIEFSSALTYAKGRR
jgi:hypothetical protein